MKSVISLCSQIDNVKLVQKIRAIVLKYNCGPFDENRDFWNGQKMRFDTLVPGWEANYLLPIDFIHALGVIPSIFLKKALNTVLELNPLS